MSIIDRLDPEFFEADDEGYMQTPSEPGPDGKAKGIEFVLYVDYPWETLERNNQPEDTWDITLTDDEVALFPAWVQEQYPAGDWSFDAEVSCEASFYDDYKEGEDTESLMMRLTVNNNDYNRIRNHWSIMFTGLENFLDYIQKCRVLPNCDPTRYGKLGVMRCPHGCVTECARKQ